MHEVRNMFGAYPREGARNGFAGISCTAVTRTLMKDVADLPLIAPNWSGGFASELFHTGSSQEGFIDPVGNNVVYKKQYETS